MTEHHPRRPDDVYMGRGPSWVPRRESVSFWGIRRFVAATWESGSTYQDEIVCRFILKSKIGPGAMADALKNGPGCCKCNWTGFQIGSPSRDPAEAARGERVAYPCPHCNKGKW